MNFLIAFFFLAITLLILFKTNIAHKINIRRKYILLALCVKLLFSVTFFFIYSLHYTDRLQSDMFRYYDDAMIMYQALPDKPLSFIKMLTGINDNEPEIVNQYYMKMNSWYKSFDSFIFNDNRTMIRINALFMIFTFGSFIANAFLFLMLGFSGLLMLFHALKFEEQSRNVLLYIMIMFFPSLTFWTANISKEALAMFALGGFMLSVRNLLNSKVNVNMIFTFLFFLFLMMIIKIYVLFSLIPSLLSLFMTRHLKPLYQPLVFIFVHCIFFVSLWNFHHIIPELNFVETFVRKQHDFIHFAQSTNAGSLLHTNFLQPNVVSFLHELPNALINAMFRPLFFDSNNWLMYLSSIENLIFILFILSTIAFFKSSHQPYPFVWLNIFFALTMLTVIGLSTPIAGSIVRYKIIAFPFIFATCISLINMTAFKKFLYRFFKIKLHYE